MTLTGWLLNREGISIANANADMDADGRISAFDLAALKMKLTSQKAPVETEVSFEEINTATWKVKDGMGGKTLTCTFNKDTWHRCVLEFAV